MCPISWKKIFLRRLPAVLNGLEGIEYPLDPFSLTAATRNWYQCPVFNPALIEAYGLLLICKTSQELSLDSKYLGPKTCRSSTTYQTPLSPSLILGSFDIQLSRTMLLFSLRISIPSGTGGKPKIHILRHCNTW